MRRNQQSYDLIQLSLIDTVAACQADGSLPPEHTERYVVLAWSVAHGLASLLLDGPIVSAPEITMSDEEAAELVLATFSSVLRAASRP